MVFGVSRVAGICHLSLCLSGAFVYGFALPFWQPRDGPVKFNPIQICETEAKPNRLLKPKVQTLGTRIQMYKMVQADTKHGMKVQIDVCDCELIY